MVTKTATLRRLIVTTTLGLAITACGADITDPDEDENYDDETAEDSKNVVAGQLPDGGPTPTGTATGAQVTCMYPQGQGTPTKVCLKQTGVDVDDYVSATCNTNLQDHSWVKAIGASGTPPKEVWVAIPNGDANFSTRQIHGSGATETTYAPSLVHNDGVITGHRDCELKVNFLSGNQCPSDLTGQSCVNTAIVNDTGSQTAG